MVPSHRPASPASVARAQELLPALAELIENNEPSREDLNFNQIEASSAASGDVLARLLMKQALEGRRASSPSEVQTAFEQARQKARVSALSAVPGACLPSPGDRQAAQAGTTPADPKVRRMRRKRKLKTIRGPVEIEREYLYFPALKTGVFPPRPTSGAACRQPHPTPGA